MSIENLRIAAKRLTDSYRRFIPEVVNLTAGMTMIASTMMMTPKVRVRYYTEQYNNTGYEIYKIKVMQLTHSNNWLKLHGYPMRRKLRK